ncbi:MAG: bifunctional 2-C-methyl-D-erythritol 4-phosphate cytidylyltransferase/2-C-methyl-D-erythritol 2,4-cyclodiphosphate synthase [Alphaproteobacteria bacterium]|nr:bifunctional 2-C-methyl-D-erythritol 4-phosphate cytidylyltransferase/2-C-methyl-D-erythritol 2,4-cyclodiphosphate synthase [Alphaproteobacteria bacterium]
MRIAALIAAAGRGERAGGGVPKQFRPVAGKPMLRWSLDAFGQSARIERTLVIAGGADGDRLATAGVGDAGWIEGAETRTGSVRRGLEVLARANPPDAVLIHDAARPGLQSGMIEALCDALGEAEATAPALPVTDALKSTDETGLVTADVARFRLWRVQTPQAFHFAPLLKAYREAPQDASYDDDLAIARAAGMTVRLIEGDPGLMKVTMPEDFVQAERMLGGGAGTPCVGAGFDAHRFGPGYHVTLCGVRIPHDKGLVGHSDADAAWHALTDAILGAIGDGDIGDHFPPTDPQWRGADSGHFLRHAADLAAKAGGRLVHVDITLICERPKVKPHREAMRARTAEVLGLPLHRVSVKATTTERLGFLGREEGLAAQAVATVVFPD